MAKPLLTPQYINARMWVLMLDELSDGAFRSYCNLRALSWGKDLVEFLLSDYVDNFNITRSTLYRRLSELKKNGVLRYTSTLSSITGNTVFRVEFNKDNPNIGVGIPSPGSGTGLISLNNGFKEGFKKTAAVKGGGMGGESRILDLGLAGTQTGSPPALEKDWKREVIDSYKNNIGPLVPAVWKKMEVALESYSPTWILEAIAIAAERNVPNWRYINGILRRWKVDGKASVERHQVDERQPGPPPGRGEAGESRESRDARLKAASALMEVRDG